MFLGQSKHFDEVLLQREGRVVKQRSQDFFEDFGFLVLGKNLLELGTVKDQVSFGVNQVL
jgi:hypothetical protein